MGIHVNIGEAKDRLSQLIAAAKRGEDVIIARAGVPEVRLTAVVSDEAKLALAAKRRAFVGSMKSSAKLEAFDWFKPMSDEELKLFYGDTLPSDVDGLPR